MSRIGPHALTISNQSVLRLGTSVEALCAVARATAAELATKRAAANSWAQRKIVA